MTDLLILYSRLHDRLSHIIEDGKLDDLETKHPRDYRWLINAVTSLAAKNPASLSNPVLVEGDNEPEALIPDGNGMDYVLAGRACCITVGMQTIQIQDRVASVLLRVFPENNLTEEHVIASLTVPRSTEGDKV